MCSQPHVKHAHWDIWSPLAYRVLLRSHFGEVLGIVCAKGGWRIFVSQDAGVDARVQAQCKSHCMLWKSSIIESQQNLDDPDSWIQT